jgi:ureidoacrylate peracid hydrolase
VNVQLFVPSRTALVNVDMQRRFVERAELGAQVLATINGLTAAAREAGMLVIHTRHVLRPDGSNMGLLAELPPIRDGELNEGTESAALHPDLVLDDRDLIVDKPRFGAFYGTDLEVILRSQSLDSIIITGISTPICCDTTAREAHARDIRAFLVADATATTGPDSAECQRVTLEIVDGMFAKVVTVKDVVEGFRATA